MKNFPTDLELPNGSCSLLRESLLQGGREMHKVSFVNSSQFEQVSREMADILADAGFSRASLPQGSTGDDWQVFESPDCSFQFIFTDDPLRDKAYLLLSCLNQYAVEPGS